MLVIVVVMWPRVKKCGLKCIKSIPYACERGGRKRDNGRKQGALSRYYVTVTRTPAYVSVLFGVVAFAVLLLAFTCFLFVCAVLISKWKCVCACMFLHFYKLLF